jgi:hypothetical protein
MHVQLFMLTLMEIKWQYMFTLSSEPSWSQVIMLSSHNVHSPATVSVTVPTQDKELRAGTN